MKPLSEQLADLSNHAKEAEDSADMARTKARATIQARVEQLQADATARTARMNAAATSHWDSARSQFKAKMDGIKSDLDTKKAELDVGRAERKAEDAEDDASVAIGLAYDAIDYAESAVLDAIVARSDVDALA